MIFDPKKPPQKKENEPLNFKQGAYNFELSQRGDYGNLEYNPVFRSSAIFFAMKRKGFDTKLSFLNYWKIKNNNNNVTFLYTIRDAEGKKLYRTFERIDKTTLTISITKILEQLKLKNDFLGSIECAFHSSEDLKYSFPAIQVFYETDDGVSCVHTNQRIFNNIEDEIANQNLNGLQTGFDVYLDDTNFSFLTFINGPVELKNRKLEIFFYNHNGEEFKYKKFYKKINGYQTIFIDFRNCDGLKEFLGGKSGFCKVLSPTKHSFNRILAGTFSNDLKRSSVTHSYYDCSETSDYIKEEKINEREYKCYLPFNMIEGIDLELVFYPIFSKSNIKISLETFDKSSGEKITIDGILYLKKGFKKPVILPINKYLKNFSISDSIYCLDIKSDERKIPSRLALGMNYRSNGFGSNISSSAIPNLGQNIKRRGYFWGPAMYGNQMQSYVSLSHFSCDKDNQETNLILLKLFNENGLIFENEYTLKNPNALNISVNDILQGMNFESKNRKGEHEILWFTLDSSNANFICNHIHKSKSNLVTADHSF